MFVFIEEMVDMLKFKINIVAVRAVMLRKYVA